MNERLRGLLADVFGLRVGDVREDMSRDDVVSWDSLKQMDLVMTLEREYAIELELAEIPRLKSVGAILEVLREKGVDVAA